MSRTVLALSVSVLLMVGVEAFTQQLKAPLSSRAANITLIATVPSYVSVVPATTQATFDFATRTRAQTAFGVTVNWSLNAAATNGLQLYAYFDTPATALVDGRGNSVAANLIDAAYGSAAYRTFPVGTQPLLLYSQPVTTANSTGTTTNPLNLRLKLPPEQQPGLYQGVLHLRAEMY